ncbi:LADA_0F02872g1_1 [Lachancea dasiensis]|uniref:LADA_0F02872g1_1 n=1 Tax=Lachancea dasiensis TaxID=1072105 RepID=A0A1G4JII6_9SACH|nr:LADA_0F02872g1_1 [Lachancea dasiensis]
MLSLCSHWRKTFTFCCVWNIINQFSKSVVACNSQRKPTSQPSSNIVFQTRSQKLRTIGVEEVLLFKTMIGLRHYSAQRPLPRRIASRLMRPPAGIPRASGWKLYMSHITGTVKPRMTELQNEIMAAVDVLGSKNQSVVKDEINQWHFHNDQAPIKTPTLLIHGYAASSMAFHRNFSGLSRQIQDLYAIDLPANGLSPSQELDIKYPEPLALKVNIKADKFQIPYTIEYLPHKCLVQNLEDYYLDALEQWRHDNGLGAINIVAHSFGGYLSFKYAIKYPQAVKKLCLISPLGVERNVFSVNNHWRSNTEYQLNFEDPASKLYLPQRPAIPNTIFESQTKLLRNLGPLGAKLCWNYIASAYSRTPSLSYKKYVFEMFYGKDGLSQISKDVFTGLFTNRLLAKDPLLDCLVHLKADDLLLLYGDHDWMNRRAGFELTREAEAMGIDANYSEVSSSGHNLFLDNPEEFNQRVLQFIAS